MNLTNDAEEVLDYFEEHCSEVTGTMEMPTSSSIRFYPEEVGWNEETEEEIVEWIRGFGVRAINETGYAISGLRMKDEYVEVWFDPIELVESESESENQYLTIAQKAATIIEESTEVDELIPNISGDPERQYVQVDPFVINEHTIEQLNEEGIEIRQIDEDKVYFE